MELTEGFKQTDLGVLPEDWDIRPLGKCLSKPPDYGINAPAVPYSSKLPTYIRITDISEDGQFAPSERVSVQSPMANAYYLEHGDLVLARTGNTVGKSYRYKAEDGRLVFAGFLIRIQPNANVLLPTFLSSYLATGAYWRWVRQMSMRSGQPGINGQEYAQLPVPVPPVEEQQAIAGALGDVDALLERLDQLIAKKRDLKQAAMQRLLTGDTRLPGFSGEWEVKRLSEIGDIRSGGTPSTRQPHFWDGDVPWCTPTDITALSGHKYLTTTERNISTAGLQSSSAEVIPARSLIMTSRATIGACAINLTPMTTNQGFKSIVPGAEVDVEFLYYLMTTQESGLVALCGGSTFLEISKKQLSAYEIRLPTDRSEQVAISAVLSDMDAELAVLGARRNKTLGIELAMMQELLTGKTRLHTTGGSNG